MNITPFRDSKPLMKAYFAKDGYFVTNEGIDFISKVFDNEEYNISCYAAINIPTFPDQYPELYQAMDEKGFFLSVEEFGKPEFNRIKKAFRYTIVATLFESNFFGYKDTNYIFRALNDKFSEFLTINMYGCSLSYGLKTYESMGYSRFILNEECISFNEKIAILDELDPIILELNEINENNLATEAFERFRNYMLGAPKLYT